MLSGRKIIVGITGSIAAYKAAMLVRGLVKAGAEVKVVMTPLAKQFITPLTMATLSKNPILVEFFDPENGQWNSHVSLGEWADAYIIAPATANTLAKMRYGIADNLLLTTYLSARCPVFIAPAMDLDMYAHTATQDNLKALAERGVTVIEPDEGELASGLTGKGRMSEPEAILSEIERYFAGNKSLQGKRIVITAGPTVESIDPVRYVSNHSTGKMGYCLATEFATRGAEVVLVSGPTSLPCPDGVKLIPVQTADQMYRHTVELFPEADGAVMCAAVADYRPADVSENKIKKGSEDRFVVYMEKTPDIAAELGKMKEDKFLAGFALETDNELQNAEDKLRRKNFDFIVLNSLRDKGSGFGTDTNKITIIDSSGSRSEYPLDSKMQAARWIVDKAEEYLLYYNIAR